jgi:hypothetical protein
MSTYAQTLYGNSEFGIPVDLDGAGSSLENPYAFDATAKELKRMAEAGLVSIVDERIDASQTDPLIEKLTFVRVR